MLYDKILIENFPRKNRLEGKRNIQHLSKEVDLDNILNLQYIFK